MLAASRCASAGLPEKKKAEPLEQIQLGSERKCQAAQQSDLLGCSLVQFMPGWNITGAQAQRTFITIFRRRSCTGGDSCCPGITLGSFQSRMWLFLGRVVWLESNAEVDVSSSSLKEFFHARFSSSRCIARTMHNRSASHQNT